MNHDDLSHILRAAQAASGESRLLVIGSQSILGSFPDAPRILRLSDEVDIATPDNPKKSDLIDGCIGEHSQFHVTFGIYGHGIAKETATLPPDWETRAISKTFEQVPNCTVTFLHPDDAVFSKLAAGRSKDFAWVNDVFKHRLSNQGSVARMILECEDKPLKNKLIRNFHISTGHTPDSVSPKHLSIRGAASGPTNGQAETAFLDKPSGSTSIHSATPDTKIGNR